MDYILDLEQFRAENQATVHALSAMLDAGGDLAPAAYSIREAVMRPWDSEEARALLTTIIESPEKLEGAILGLHLAEKLYERLLDIHKDSRADDVSEDEHMARLLSMGSVAHTSVVTRVLSICVTAYCATKQALRAPVWVLKRKEGRRASDHANM